MGLASLPQLREQLIAAGLPASTPAAAVENGTRSTQRRCLSTLDKLPDDVVKMSICSPALIIIGNVVNFAEELDWFRPTIEEYAAEEETTENHVYAKQTIADA